MELKFLGKGSAFYPVYGNTGAYMLYGKELYLIDCGETAFDQLYRRIRLDEIEKVYVLQTHLHADHVGSLGSLISYFHHILNRQGMVIHPQPTITQLLTLEGIDPRGYIYEQFLPENAAGLHAEPVEVKHATDMKCYGYVITDQNESIYYSGDSSELPPEIRKRFLAGEIQRIYHDTASEDLPNPSHCYYGKMEEWIPKEKRSQIYCMHLDSPCEDMLRSRGFSLVEVEEKAFQE